MSAELTAEEALERIPDWPAGETRIEAMPGGLTNRVYRLRADGRQCVLRLDAGEHAAMVPDRDCEVGIMETAASAGLAPAILFADPDAGILVTEYLEGRVWQNADLESTRNLEALAELLRRVHALPACGRRMKLEDAADNYLKRLDRRETLRAFAETCVSIIADSREPDSTSCCHNDIVAPNVIQAGGLRLIDWEYACDNDPLFDLASLIGYHDLDASRQEILLSAYAGGTDAELRERLDSQLRVYDAIQWLWLAARELRSPRREQLRRLETLRQRIR